MPRGLARSRFSPGARSIRRCALSRRSRADSPSATTCCTSPTRRPTPPECPAQLFSLRASGSGASGNLAVFPASITREGLLGAAQEAFGFYARWGDGVLDLIAANAGLDAIVNYAYAMF